MKQLRYRAFVCCMAALWLLLTSQALGWAPPREFYQLTTYHLKSEAQEARLDAYFQKAYLPALRRMGISKVGVFKPISTLPAASATPSERLVFVLTPFTSAEHYVQLSTSLDKDQQYQNNAQDYLNTAFDNPVYSRFETVLLSAFAGMPTLQLPTLKSAPDERVYELRSYEGASEKLHLNKVAQFNNSEIGIFKRLDFNTVFCGQVVAGSKMPNLMYLSAFANKEAQAAHWKAFGEDPEWKKVREMPQYANNMLRMDIYLLRPTAYSAI